MPVEIRELTIRATLIPKGEEKRTAQEREKAGVSEELVAECVEQVLEILRKERER